MHFNIVGADRDTMEMQQRMQFFHLYSNMFGQVFGDNISHITLPDQGWPIFEDWEPFFSKINIQYQCLIFKNNIVYPFPWSVRNLKTVICKLIGMYPFDTIYKPIGCLVKLGWSLYKIGHEPTNNLSTLEMG